MLSIDNSKIELDNTGTFKINKDDKDTNIYIYRITKGEDGYTYVISNEAPTGSDLSYKYNNTAAYRYGITYDVAVVKIPDYSGSYKTVTTNDGLILLYATDSDDDDEYNGSSYALFDLLEMPEESINEDINGYGYKDSELIDDATFYEVTTEYSPLDEQVFSGKLDDAGNFSYKLSLYKIEHEDEHSYLYCGGYIGMRNLMSDNFRIINPVTMDEYTFLEDGKIEYDSTNNFIIIPVTEKVYIADVWVDTIVVANKPYYRFDWISGHYLPNIQINGTTEVMSSASSPYQKTNDGITVIKNPDINKDDGAYAYITARRPVTRGRKRAAAVNEAVAGDNIIFGVL